jgi:DNA-binding response OmpR family regulator
MNLSREDQLVKYLVISVKDTGVGIEPDQLPFIFNRFYQANRPPVHGHEGTGVGLSIVSELIRVHKGEIDVESTPDSGTVFRIRIPYGKQHLTTEEIDDSESLEKPATIPLQPVMSEEMTELPFQSSDTESEKPRVLVVEDHIQVRRYIIESIHKKYRILQAANVPDGFELAQESIPDLIISDIMMPGTDGFKFCEQLKRSEKTSHIPIILLTARAEMTDKIAGLKWGADDYLTKPFNVEELKTRIGNLIENRNVLRKKFSSNSIIKPAEISVSPQDASFISKLIGLIEKNMDNSQYSIEAFSIDVGLSQSQLHRKLKAIINMSAIQFITSVRMHRAMELLKKDAGNIAEIAYMVGYDDPGYFSKSFRRFFKKLPSEVIKNS